MRLARRSRTEDWYDITRCFEHVEHKDFDYWRCVEKAVFLKGFCLFLRCNYSKRDASIRTFFYAVSALFAVLHMCDGRLFVNLLVDPVSTCFHTRPTTITTIKVNFGRNINSPCHCYWLRVLRLEDLRHVGNGHWKVVGRGRFELPIPWSLASGRWVHKTQTRNHFWQRSQVAFCSQSRPPTHVFVFFLSCGYKSISGFMKIIQGQLPDMVQDAVEYLLEDYSQRLWRIEPLDFPRFH